MTVAQDNWVFLGSNISASGEQVIRVPRDSTAPPRSPSFPYYDLLMVRYHIKMVSADTLYFSHNANVLGNTYNSRIWSYPNGSNTPSETNSAPASTVRLMQATSSDAISGVIMINNIPNPSTGQRTFEATTVSLNNGGTPPTIQLVSGFVIYATPMTAINIGTATGGFNLTAGSTMSVFGCNII